LGSLKSYLIAIEHQGREAEPTADLAFERDVE
jgi:hypothetical protein